MNSRDLIVICITIILLISIGIFMTFNLNAGETTIITMTNSPTLNEGDSLILKLNTDNGTAIKGEKIEINLTHKDNGVTENFTLKTDSNGECRLEDLPAGNYSLLAKYYGNSKYKESTISGDITVNKKSKAGNKTKSSTRGEYKSNYTVDEVIGDWDPSEHEVSREDLGDGTIRITYDDGYFRIVDEEGHILTYGY